MYEMRALRAFCAALRLFYISSRYGRTGEPTGRTEPVPQSLPACLRVPTRTRYSRRTMFPVRSVCVHGLEEEFVVVGGAAGECWLCGDLVPFIAEDGPGRRGNGVMGLEIF